MTDPESILIIRPSALGDVCRSVPVASSLRNAYPRARIDWLVQAGFEPAIEGHPSIDRTVLFPRSRVAIGRLRRAEARRELNSLLKGLKRARYDMVFDCQGLGRSGFFAWATRAPRRIGFSGARELGWLGCNERFDIPADLHTVDRMLGLIEAAGVEPARDMRLFTTQAQRDTLDPRLRGKRFALLAPTSRWPGKRWPAERFAELASAILDQTDAEAVAFTGASNERAQCAPLEALAKSDSRVVDLIGSGGVGTLLAHIEASSLVVANDSAALHMAVGFDKPLIGLFGPTRIDLVGPYQREEDVIQPPIKLERNRHKDDGFGAEAMALIESEQVIEAAVERLRQRPTVSRRGPKPRADLWR